MTDRNVTSFKEKGNLKAFACGVAEAIKETSPKVKTAIKDAAGTGLILGGMAASAAVLGAEGFPIYIFGAACVLDHYINKEKDQKNSSETDNSTKNKITSIIKNCKNRQ
ncbi:MAG: hypothetical protein AB7U85_02470 [Alphaproteobacteria bacterium]